MNRCRECGQQIPPPGSSAAYVPQRVCFLCEVPIGRHHKFVFIRENGVTRIRHRHCDDPEAYINEAGERLQPSSIDPIMSSGT